MSKNGQTVILSRSEESPVVSETRSRGRALNPVLAALLLVLLVASAACGAEPKPRDVALPTGFADAGVPATELRAYLYVHPATPVSYPVQRLLKTKSLADAQTMVKVIQSQQFVGPSNVLISLVRFDSEATATTVADLLVRDVQPGMAEVPGEGMRFERRGAELAMTRGQGPWVEETLAALREGRTKALSEAQPKAWDLLRLLTDRPPSPVIASGFLTVKEGPHAQGGEPGLGELAQVLQFASADTAAFTVHGDAALVLPADGSLGLGLLFDKRLSVSAVTRAGLPGFIVNLAIGALTGQAGLQKTTIGATDAYYRALPDKLHLFVKNQGNALFFSLGSDHASAEALGLALFPE